MDNTDRRQVVLGALGAAALAGAAGAQPLPTTTAGLGLRPPWTKEGYVERPGGKLHYVEMGQGEPVVLLHKLGGWVSDWRYVAPLLAAQNRRVIAFDMPGHGLSAMDRPPPFVYTLGESAAMINAALQDMGVERFALVGSSLGGCAGVVLAASYPQSVSKMALISVALGEAQPRASLIKADADAGNYLGNGSVTPRTMDQVKSFGTIDPRVNDEANLSRAQAGVWVRASEHGVDVAGVADYLPRVQAPTLLVYADRGAYTHFEPVGRARLKTVSVAIIANTGSFTYLEKPVETAAAVNRFLSTPA
jgi:pimeloyl-ACP methyl ester carboxylesterase